MAKKKNARSSGSKYVQTFSYNGKRYYCYGSSKIEVCEKAVAKKEELKRKGFIATKDMTLKQYFEKWNDARIGVVSDATIRKQKFEFEDASQMVVDGNNKTFGDLLLSDISAQNMRDLQKYLQTVEKRNKKLAITTINGIMSLMKHIFTDAVKEQIIGYNPTVVISNLKKPEHNTAHETHRALTIDETKLFFNKAIDSAYYDCFRFMAYTGCRCGEVGALKLSDIDFKNNKIYIQRTITKDTDGVYHLGETTKTAHGKRTLELTKELKVVIKSQLKMNSIMRGNVEKIDGLIFASPSGDLLNDTCCNREIARICKRTGITRFTCHGFRDTFATRCVESGMNPKTLQTILGHANIQMTMNIYAKCLPSTVAKEMNNVVIGL